MSSLKKEYVVTEISAAPNGSPYVLLSLKDPDEVGGPQQPPTAAPTTFRSMDDMFQNFGRIFSKQMLGSFTTVIKLGLDAYEHLDIKVGDRVALELNKVQVSIP